MEVWQRNEDSVCFDDKENAYSHLKEPDEDEDELIDELIAEMEQRSATTPKKQYAVDAWGDLYEVNPTE